MYLALRVTVDFRKFLENVQKDKKKNKTKMPKERQFARKCISNVD